MQSKLIQELYSQAKLRVAETFPESNLLNIEQFLTSWRLWELNGGTGLKFFLILAPSPKDDSFALEIAWSADGRLPHYKGRLPDEDRGDGEMLFRLSSLWHRYGGEHRWYLGSYRGTQEIMIPAPDEPLDVKYQSVAPQVADAFEKLKQYGVPYYKEIAARYGVELKVRA